jgi:hypothetical protein
MGNDIKKVADSASVINKFISLFILPLFILGICAGCSGKKQEPSKGLSAKSIYKKIRDQRKMKAEMARNSPLENEKLRTRYLAVADACDRKFTSCVDGCSTSDCEDLCLKTLASCDKELPEEFKTLK